MKGHYQKAPSVKKTFPEPKATEHYEKELGPEKPSDMERLKSKLSPITGNRFIQGAITAVSTRSAQVAHEMRESPAKERREHGRGRRGESYDTPFPSPPPDPFGITAPFVEPKREYVPRRKPAKRQHRQAPRRTSASRQPQFPQMFGIPKHMRHLF